MTTGTGRTNEEEGEGGDEALGGWSSCAWLLLFWWQNNRLVVCFLIAAGKRQFNDRGSISIFRSFLGGKVDRQISKIEDRKISASKDASLLV
jgi:hypothetical protein